MKTRLFVILGCAAVLLATVPVWAHHSFGAEFDINKPVKLKGTVVKWELTNPHTWITLDVKGEDGKIATWRVEGLPPNNLLRLGFTKDSLPPGTEIVVEGYQAKDKSLRASGKNVTFSDGRTLMLGLTTVGTEAK
jgi:hypothetical protein